MYKRQAIRPTIGLNKMQSMATMNYYKHVKETLQKNNPTMKEATAAKYAREASHKYAGKLHRQRAYTIATTEMAFAYNKGADEGIRQAQEQGLMGMTRKVWSTAADERAVSYTHLIYDGSDNLTGMIQTAPPSFETIELPIEKLLLFRTKSRKGNPERCV